MTAVRKKKVANHRNRTLSYKDVQILFLAKGIADIEKGVQDGTIKVSALRRAAEAFGDSASAETLVAFAQARAPTGQRGRRAVEIGEARDYKSQQVDDAKGLFIRLPVDLLIKKKGDKVSVSFEKERFVVRAKG